VPLFTPPRLGQMQNQPAKSAFYLFVEKIKDDHINWLIFKPFKPISLSKGD
jgi:hypothetical protein